MKSFWYILSLILFATLGQWGLGCNKKDDSKGRLQAIEFSVPEGWPDPVYDFSANPLSKEGVALGKKLFFDGRLSKDGNFPCVSCHQPFAAFATFEHDLSHGFNDQFTTRNAPGLFNLAWHRSFHQDGGITHLDLQPLAPITASNEMAETIEGVLTKLNADGDYQKSFARVFGSPEITTANMTKALSQYMLMLVSANSKYDLVKQGKASFDVNEEAGYAVFLDKKCNTCHTEPLFTNLEFAYNGLPLNPAFNDLGRMGITGRKEDSLKFKVPSLRNIALTFPYMHDGRLWNLEDVYDHYNKTIPLSSIERSLLTEFFKTLTDEKLVNDPVLTR